MILISPIIKKEIEVRSRRSSFMAGLICLSLCLTGIGVVASLGALRSMQAAHEARYGLMMQAYALVALAAYILLSFSAPLLTAAEISGEKEAGSLDLLLSTRLTPRDIVIEKFIAAFISIITLLSVSLPAVLIPLMAGGIGLFSALKLLLSFIPGLFLALSIGLFMSAVCSSSLKSLALTYGVIVLINAGFIFITYLIPGLSFILIVDPLMPVLKLICAQTGIFGVSFPYMPAAFILDIALSVLLIAGSARAFDPCHS